MNQPAAENYIGLMSGTSLDGIDVAIVDFASFPPQLRYSSTTGYDDALRERLRALYQSPSTTLDALYRLDAELAELYAQCVNRALQQASLDAQDIVALGCHGQTIWHSPDTTPAFTAQIGDPSRLARLTAITTVADFRRMDMAFGGQGAPLAPVLHRFLFRSEAENRAVINIGGIANITYLPGDPEQPVLGFDTGPGNTLLDLWIGRHRQKAFDEDGDWARSGRVIASLLDELIDSEAYFSAGLAKTTGTDHFNLEWLEPRLDASYAAADVQATLLELSARTITAAIAELPAAVHNCYVCGGGASNSYLMQRLTEPLDCPLQTTAALGLDPDYVEAVAFAWLARERLALRPGNLSEVTHAERDCILGGVYTPA